MPDAMQSVASPTPLPVRSSSSSRVPMMIAPVGALAWSNAGGLGIEKQGTGLVLFITLQRQSMS